MLLVDANIFLELFLGQKKADECQNPNNKNHTTQQTPQP